MLLTHSSFFSLCRHSQMSALCGKIWDALISCILGSLINSGCCQQGPVQRWQKPHKTGLCSVFSHCAAPQMILLISSVKVFWGSQTCRIVSICVIFFYEYLQHSCSGGWCILWPHPVKNNMSQCTRVQHITAVCGHKSERCDTSSTHRSPLILNFM